MRNYSRIGSLCVALSVLFVTQYSRCDETATLNGDEIVRRLNARDDGKFLYRTMSIELIDKRGAKRFLRMTTYLVHRRILNGCISLSSDDPAVFQQQTAATILWVQT